MEKILRNSILLLVMFVAGCATMSGSGQSSWGRFVPDLNVLRNIEAGNLDPDMNYYYSGPEKTPLAIMGLSKKYVLDNKRWKPILDPQMCMVLVRECQVHDLLDNVRDLHGYSMISSDGRKVGIWYSDIYVRMVFKMGQDNKVIVFTPDQPTDEYGLGEY